jgi:zinc transporter
MADDDGLIFAVELDGKGGAQPLDWEGVARLWNEEALVWIHLDYTAERARTWLRESSGLDPVTVGALLEEETRPRSVVIGDGLLVNLRAVNLNPGAEPDDMVSLRMWIEHHQIATLRRRRVKAVNDVKEALDCHKGPLHAGEVLMRVADRIVVRIGEALAETEELIDTIEEETLEKDTQEMRARVADARRTVIGVRRFLAPQRDAMNDLISEEVSWLDENCRARLREIANRLTQQVEDLDSIRDRAAICQEEANARLAQKMNRTMVALSVVACIFLPLSLLTGLLGINVAGIPGADHPWAFWVVCGILVAVAALEVTLLRRKL